MANIFKKLISGICSAAMISAMAVPVMADAAAETWDYTASGAQADWTGQDSNVVQTIDNNMLVITNNRDATRYAEKAFSSDITKSALVEYDIQFKCYGQGVTSLYMGKSSSDYLLKMDFAQYGTGVSVNGSSQASMTSPDPSNRVSPWMHIKHIFNFDTNKIDTVITYLDSGAGIYSGTTSYASASATESLSMMRVTMPKINGQFKMKVFTASLYNIPTITFENVSSIEVGDRVKVASASVDLDIADITLSNSTAFSADVDGKDVYLTALDTAVSGDSTTVTVKARGDAEATAVSGEITALTPDEIGSDVYSKLELSGDKVKLLSGNEYDITGSFDLPLPSNGKASLEWESTSSFVDVSDGKTAAVARSADIEGTTLELRAKIGYGTYSQTKTFVLNLHYDPTVVYYNEDFETFTTGTTLANMSETYSENSAYEEQYAMTFKSSYRADGAHDTVKLSVAGASSNKYLNYTITQNANDARMPKIYLSRTTNMGAVSNALVISLDAQFPAAEKELLIKDSNGETITFTAPGAEYYGKWLHFSFIQKDGSANIIISDNNGNIISKKEESKLLSDVNLITVNTASMTNLLLDNLYIADAVVPEVTAVENVVIVGESETVAQVKDAKNVTVTLSNNSDFSASYSDGKVIVTSTSAVAASTNVTVKAEAWGVETTETYTVSSMLVSDVINAAKAQNSVFYASDKKGEIIKPEIKDGGVVFNDLVLPKKEKVTVNGFEYTADVKWEVAAGNAYLSSDGIITVSDESAHDVTLKKTVSYSKNGEVKASDFVSYALKVQFAHEDTLLDVNTAITAAGADEAAAEALRKAAVYDYQVKFDKACKDNFNAIPKSAASNIKLPTKGIFGSSFTWSSSIPTVISNLGVYNRPSSDKTVVLTVSIISGSASDSATFSVAAAGSGSGGGGSSSGGGKGGTIASTTTVAAAPVSESAEAKIERLKEEAAAANDLFKDLSSVPWAREAINALAAVGVINGKSDTEFAPGDTVTRAEFAKMLMGAFGLASDSYATSSFRDVSTDAWYFQFVEAAYNLGIINGIADGVFAPDALITRQDMAVMVQRAAEAAGKSIEAVGDAINFADSSKIADYAKTAVDMLTRGGIINGVSDTEFAPLENATRAQAAKILYNFLDKQ